MSAEHETSVMQAVDPTVPKCSGCPRMNVTCDHERDDLDYAVHALSCARAAAKEADAGPLKELIGRITCTIGSRVTTP